MLCTQTIHLDDLEDVLVAAHGVLAALMSTVNLANGQSILATAYGNTIP